MSEGTWSSPKASLSVLVEEDILVDWLKYLADEVVDVDLRVAEVRAAASFAEVEISDDLGRAARDAAAAVTVTDLAANERNISPGILVSRSLVSRDYVALMGFSSACLQGTLNVASMGRLKV